MDVWYILMAVSIVGFILSLIAFMWTAIHWRVPDLWAELHGGSRKRQAKRSKAKEVYSTKEYMARLGHARVNAQSQVDYASLQQAKENNLRHIAKAKGRNLQIHEAGDYDEEVDWDSVDNEQIKELDKKLAMNTQRTTVSMEEQGYPQEQYYDYNYEQEQPTGYLEEDQQGYSYEYEQPTGYLEGNSYDYEQPTGYLDDSQRYDQPTGYLDDSQGYEQPTGYLDDEQSTGYLDDNQGYEQPTGYLNQAFEEYPAVTQLSKDLSLYDTEMSNAEEESKGMSEQNKYMRKMQGISNAISKYNNRKITVLVDRISDE